MDRSLKERLAGAVVLVLLAVWLIPQVLDGPDGPSRRSTQSLTLPAPASDAGTRIETVRLDDKKATPKRTEPAPQPAAASPPVAKPVAKPVGKPGVSKQKTPPSPPEAAAGWFVQLGSFADKANASRLAEQIRDLGFEAEVSRYTAGKTVLHRVRVGPRPTRVAAEALASDLARRGYPGQVVEDG